MSLISGVKSAISFELNRNPRIASRPADFRKYIPEPYDGVVIISADFELAWAWRYAKNLEDPLADSISYARKARANIPQILAYCEQYAIPITWATVGHLFLDHCQKDQQGHAHPEIGRLNHFENEWWRFSRGDWFDCDPCTSSEEDDAWYAPDLIQKIKASAVNHEIGCHTFSHIDCSDRFCPPQTLQSELQACSAAAQQEGISLKSFVFPGHTMGNFKTIRQMGYDSVRTNYINVLGYPSWDEYGLWRHEATMEINFNPAWPMWYNLYRYRSVLKKTIKNNVVCHLWFHPSLEPKGMEVMESVLASLAGYRKELWVTTMGNYTHWLNTGERTDG